ncbi:hypothetical protein [Luteibacter sp.]|jgi:predicted acyl esterase|uniref:hypothetical protein n=1 Tax=Luteibacter sp. TaxID=1886636 RepID=UPI002F3E7FA3
MSPLIVTSTGRRKRGSDTGTAFRQQILRPFLAQYLKDDAPKADIASVNAFVTGENAWRMLDVWPSSCRWSPANRSNTASRFRR